MFLPLTQLVPLQFKLINKVQYYSEQFVVPAKNEGTMKQRIYIWLRTLSPAQIEQVFSFTSVFRVNLILKLFSLDQACQNEYYYYDTPPFMVAVNDAAANYCYIRELNRLDDDKLRKKKAAWQTIIDCTHVADYEFLFDTIILKGPLEMLLDCLETITDGQLLTRLGFLEQNEEEEYFEATLKRDTSAGKQFLTIADIIVQEIEKAIQLRFLQFDHKANFTKQIPLLTLQTIVELFKSTSLPSLTEFNKILQVEPVGEFITEQLLVASWRKFIKKDHVLEVDEITNRLLSIGKLLYVPLVDTLNVNVLASKYVLSQQLLQKITLNRPVVDLGDFKKKKKKKPPTVAVASTTQSLNQEASSKVGQYFQSDKKSEILPMDSKTPVYLFKKESEHLQERQQQDELAEYSKSWVSRVMEETMLQRSIDKKVLKDIKKLKKNQKVNNSDSTTNCTDSISLHQQQLLQEQSIDDVITEDVVLMNDDVDSQGMSKKQKWKKREKTRKKEQQIQQFSRIQEKKKQKQEIQNEQKEKISEIDDMINQEKSVQQVKQQVEEVIEQPEQQEIAISNNANDDSSDYIEVQPKRKQKSKHTSNKKKKNNQQHFKDDSSLPDDSHIQPRQLQLNKTMSQSQAQSTNSNYLSDDNNTIEKPFRLRLQKKENVRSGLVKAAPKKLEKNSYESIDKGKLSKIYRSILEHKLTNDINETFRSEKEAYNKYKSARDISIQRVQHLVKCVYSSSPYVEAKIFGSYTSGLALDESDIDIVITGLCVYHKQHLYEPMKQLMDVFLQMSWVLSCKHIFSAAVPVIKLEIDPSVAFFQFTHGRQLYYLINKKNPDELSLRMGEPSKNMHIDITFDIFVQYPMDPSAYHFGLQSTEYTMQLCRESPAFTEVTIILKKLLKSKQLNDSYTGGVSSFCLTLMIEAMGHDKNAGSKLLGFLHKYGCQFDSDKWGICIDKSGDQDNFINLESNETNLPLTIYSPLTMHPIITYVTQVQKVLQAFKDLYLSLMSHIDCIESSLLKSFDANKLQELAQLQQWAKLSDKVQWQNNANIVQMYFQ